jgi:RNA polymerase sigma-70 factor (ECF subfamily)
MESKEVFQKGKIRDYRSTVEALYNRYASSFLSLSLRYCGNREDAEDVLHETFIKILIHLPSFRKRSQGSFEGWMRRILINTALNFIRDRFKEMRHLSSDNFQHDPEESDPDVPGSFPGCRLPQDEILQLIIDLPPGYRTVFNLYVMEEYSHREIAGLLHISENTSKSQLSKARAILRRKILERIKEPTFA